MRIIKNAAKCKLCGDISLIVEIFQVFLLFCI